jgi:hypothetical protein
MSVAHHNLNRYVAAASILERIENVILEHEQRRSYRDVREAPTHCVDVRLSATDL